MKNLIVNLLLSVVTVSLGAFYIPINEQRYNMETNIATVQKMATEIASHSCRREIIVQYINESKNNYDTVLREIERKMESLNNIGDKKEWFLEYKSIIEEYGNLFGPPEKIYDYFSDKELDLLFRVVQAEIGDEQYSFEQKVNVASVIFNRLDHEKFPNSLIDILVADQFETILNGRYLEVNIMEDTILACEYAFGIEDTAKGCLFFDSNNTLNYKYIFFDGAHNFYGLKEEKIDGGELILLQE